tara:strand:- start:49063 stop:50400 length:1338 start_codon:yes stop_codon:yes gene_type:complete
MKIRTKNRSIKTTIPAPGTQQLINKLSKIESRSMHGQLPIVWSKAKNYSVYDIKGNKFIDFTSTIFVANIGHSNPNLIKQIKSHLKIPLLNTYAYANKIRYNYLNELVKFTGLKNMKAFLMSSGTESTEAAFKIMRMYGQKTKKRKNGIICFEGNWHGRTLGAQMMSGNKNQKRWISHIDRDIHHFPFPYPWVMKQKNCKQIFNMGLKKLKNKNLDIKKDISGIMLESFQGWGAIFYPKEFITIIKKIAKENKILICFDEMQAGFARTGKRFGFENYNIKPDLICCGKGMGGGYPISGLIGKSNLMDLPSVGNMSSTHSANPLSCAAGLSVISEIKNKNLLKQTIKKGKLLFKLLNKIKITNNKSISYVLGKGLIAAIIFNKNIPNINRLVTQVAYECMCNGLLVVHTGRESIKIGPPLTISNEAIIEGVNVIEKSIKKVFRNVY